MVAQLVEIYNELYENEPEENYDMDGAREYWRTLPMPELEQELGQAKAKLADYKA
jgi:hypothetical protein